MSILHEIHNQPPTIRYAMFFLSTALAVSAVVFVTVSSLQKDIYFATHPNPVEQEEYLARRDAQRPQPIAALSRVTGSLLGSIGSLIGWDSDAGFDRDEQQSNTQDKVYLLPLSQ